MLIKIDIYAEKPIYEQLYDGIIIGIASGQLKAGESLPSARNLAADLGISFHTVNKSYDILRSRGYIIMNRRKTAMIAVKTPQDIPEILSEKLALCVAEAICNGIDESTLTKACSDNYRKIKGGFIE
ncbi:MAG: GntR family transcriptional regulator [Lachnospiraceae bacterium]|nr:GntR family transcriptional regulator [Lachnospiraceae bacterium]